MILARTMLRPAARIAGLHAAGQLRQFLRAHAEGRRVQDRLLMKLVTRFAHTRFGRDHGLGAVRNYDDFRRAVPLGDYDTQAPYLEAVYHGDTEALVPAGDGPLRFALTSGTTGWPTRIPVTAESLSHYRRGWNAFGYRMLQDHPNAWMRRILQVSSPAAESFSPTGVPCGAISGMLMATQKRIVRRMYTAGAEVAAIRDPETKYYTILRLAIPQDVGWISTANPSTVVKLLATANRHVESLLRDLRDGTLTPPSSAPGDMRRLPGRRLHKHPRLVRRIEAGLRGDGELLTRHFWDLAILLHWTGGTLGLYLPEVRRLTDAAPIRDIGLLASEGRFSIPLQDETPDGVAEILGALLEFIPADEIDSASPTVLRSHEVEVGAEYFLVFSNFSGLWRYNLHDRIRVTGRFGESPIFAFLSKGAHTANMTGEKITEHQVVQAVEGACRRLGLGIQRFLAQGHFDSPPHYLLTVEYEGRPPHHLAKTVDAELQALNIEYADKRRGGRLGIIRVNTADAESFARRERQILHDRGGLTEQYKHQYLLTDVAQRADDRGSAGGTLGTYLTR